LSKRWGMIGSYKMMIRDEELALKLQSLYPRLRILALDSCMSTPYSTALHVLQTEHLDVGFVLSGFGRRYKVSQSQSQRPVGVKPLALAAALAGKTKNEKRNRRAQHRMAPKDKWGQWAGINSATEGRETSSTDI
jgi:hypothetical protein